MCENIASLETGRRRGRPRAHVGELDAVGDLSEIGNRTEPGPVSAPAPAITACPTVTGPGRRLDESQSALPGVEAVENPSCGAKQIDSRIAIDLVGSIPRLVVVGMKPREEK